PMFSDSSWLHRATGSLFPIFRSRTIFFSIVLDCWSVARGLRALFVSWFLTPEPPVQDEGREDNRGARREGRKILWCDTRSMFSASSAFSALACPPLVRLKPDTT